jgi:transposase
VNAHDQLIIDIIEKLNSKKITLQIATQVLNVSERTIYRHMKGISESGVAYFQHGNKNKIPKNKTSCETLLIAKNLMKEKYFDFNVTHALEKLKSEDNIVINRESFRKICHEINLVKRQKRRSRKVHKVRSRTSQAGIMLQMDGSPHRWFGVQETCLIGAIDDANNENYYSEFFESETTVGCLKVLRRIIEKKGLFNILYTDRAGLFAGPKRAEFSQVKRALSELGIQIIYANSAEAKGRIERHWQTLQDRLVPEMRLRNITSFAGANEFLNNQFLPNEYNKNFKVIPSNLESGWRPLPSNINLDEVFCLKHHRQVKNDHTYSFEGQIFKITSDLRHSIQNQKIEIRIYPNNETKVYFAERELDVEVHHNNPKAETSDKLIVTSNENDLFKVRKDGHVFYKNKYYSVASEYVEKMVVVREHKDFLLIYYKTKLIESHPIITNKFNKNSTKPEHLKPWQSTLLPTSIYRKTASKIGPHCDKLIFSILHRGQGVVDNATIWAILKLTTNYTSVCINEACEFAINTDSMGLRSVMSYLNLRARRTGTIK